jgi:ubiquinone biosynthesis protein Coq4
MLVQPYEFEFTARFSDSRMGAYQLAEAGTIDIVHLAQIKHDLAMTLANQFMHRRSHGRAAFAKRYLPAEIDYGNVAHFPACPSQRHRNLHRGL